MKVSDGCHCGVNMIVASRTVGGVQKHSRLQYDPIFIRNTI